MRIRSYIFPFWQQVHALLCTYILKCSDMRLIWNSSNKFIQFFNLGFQMIHIFRVDEIVRLDLISVTRSVSQRGGSYFNELSEQSPHESGQRAPMI